MKRIFCLCAQGVILLAAGLACSSGGAMSASPTPTCTDVTAPMATPGSYQEVAAGLLRTPGLGEHISSWSTNVDGWQLVMSLDSDSAKAAAECELVRLGVPAGAVNLKVEGFAQPG